MKKIIFLLLPLIDSLFSSAQGKPVIKNLVFEGAGIKGIAYCGVISELETRQLMQQVEASAGTSSGALMALMVSLGYSSAEMEEIIGKTKFSRFNDGAWLFAGGINRINKYFGWYKGRQLEKWLEPIITKKTGNSDITFEELHQKGFRDLYVTGTCLNKQKLIVFSRKTYPRMKVKDAVRISMSIPLYFEAIFIDQDGRMISRPKKKKDLDVMVDGGFTGNFPITLFDSVGQTNFATLGFRIDSDEQIENDSKERSIAGLPVNSLKEYVKAFYNIIVENLNRQPLTDADWQRTVSVSDGGVGPRIRKLSLQEVSTLIENGRLSVKKYLN